MLAALTILAVTLIAVGGALFQASHRFRTSHQSSRWAQAEQAAEAGAEIALTTAQKNSWEADNWSGALGAPGSAAVTKTITLSAATPAETGSVSTRVSVDKVNMGASDWIRIRSTGTVNVYGGSLAGIDQRDVMLRKLSLRSDRNTGSGLVTPEATRTVEILAEPFTEVAFPMALLVDTKIYINGSGVWVDSFDSSDPQKSTNGQYDTKKKQKNADIGVNDSLGQSNLGNSYVGGDLDYSGPTILGIGGVTGKITTPFSKPLSPVRAPGWATFDPTITVLDTTTTLTGGPKTSPARYKLSSVSIDTNEVVTMAPHANGQESYVEIWVTGDFSSGGKSVFLSKPGVHVTYYIEGSVSVTGKSFDNKSGIAANNLINLVNPPEGVVQTFLVGGQGRFIGAINAPGADISVSGNGIFNGAVIGKTMTITGNAAFHYDQALANLTGSAGIGNYRVVSWVEAVR